MTNNVIPYHGSMNPQLSFHFTVATIMKIPFDPFSASCSFSTHRIYKTSPIGSSSQWHVCLCLTYSNDFAEERLIFLFFFYHFGVFFWKFSIRKAHDLCFRLPPVVKKRSLMANTTPLKLDSNNLKMLAQSLSLAQYQNQRVQPLQCVLPSIPNYSQLFTPPQYSSTVSVSALQNTPAPKNQPSPISPFKQRRPGPISPTKQRRPGPISPTKQTPVNPGLFSSNKAVDSHFPQRSHQKVTVKPVVKIEPVSKTPLKQPAPEQKLVRGISFIEFDSSWFF